MALKGGRKIVVRGLKFQWTLSGKDKGSRWGGTAHRPHVVIQMAEVERSGTPMVAYLESRRFISVDAHDLDMGGVVHRATVFPRDIRSLIEHALDDGWDPSGKVQYISPGDINLGDYTTRAK